jgi:uncharacterized protein (TIGR02001 family)
MHQRGTAGRWFIAEGRLVWLMVTMLAGNGCRADDAMSASLGMTSNYVYRGVSQSDHGAALQLGVNYQSPRGWFAGVWGSNVDPYPGGSSFKELDAYAGYIRPVGDEFTVRGTYTHYAYVQNRSPLNYDHNEWAATVAYLDVLAATLSYQPDYSSYSDLGAARKRRTMSYEMTGRWPVGAGVAVTAGGGYYDLHALYGIGYWAGEAGFSYAYRRLTVELSRFFVDGTVTRLYQDASANGAWVISAVMRF